MRFVHISVFFFMAALMPGCGDSGGKEDAAADPDMSDEDIVSETVDTAGEDITAETEEGSDPDADITDAEEEEIPVEDRELSSTVLLGEGGFFGISGLTAGELTGSDAGSFLIGGHYADISDGGGEAQPAGRLYFFDNGSFPASIDERVLTLQPPDGALGGGFGYSIASPCDFNNDGFLDIAVGNHLYSDETHNYSGRAVVFQGDADGIALERYSYHRLSEELRDSADSVGQTVLCGNFNGDEFDDLLATGQNGGRLDTGIGAIFFGTAGGLPENHDAEIYPLLPENRQYFGSASLWEDLDGDGDPDLAVGGWGMIKGPHATGPHTGGVAVFPGGADWSMGPAYGLYPDVDNEVNMGMDLDFFRIGDADYLAVSASDYGDSAEGAVLIFATGYAGFHEDPPLQVLSPPEGMIDTGFGGALAFIPDYFGADRGALLVGMKYGDASPGNTGTGIVAVYTPASEDGPFEAVPAILAAPEPKPNDGFGGAIVPLDDVDHDGLRDFFVSIESHIEGDIWTGDQTGGVVFFQ